jgi:hypothetical protein
MENQSDLRKRLAYALQGKGAHLDLEKVLLKFPQLFRGKSFPQLPYTAWQLLEHMRIAQWDILEFCRDANHISPKWPEGYWPEEKIPPNEPAWDNAVSQFFSDLHAMQDLVENPATDLHQNIPHGSGQNILREAILVLDHNAYHLGQLVLLRKIFEGNSDD